jgi:3-hydroxyisobutyrate dehydrogenase-like beta-hydroxyacid dehydrogenase
MRFQKKKTWTRLRRGGTVEVGFVGVGRMGSAMAANLLKAGHRVKVWDKSVEPLRALQKQGAEIAADARDAFRGDALFSMLPNDDVIRDVFITGRMQPASGTPVHVNMATASIQLAKDLAAYHAGQGVPYVAATVWGRPDVAAAGKLSIVVAGDPQAIARVQPLLDVIGQKTWHVGDEPSRANLAKIAGNLMVACAIEAIAEAAALVRAHGMSAPDVLDAIITSLFNVPVYRGYGEMIAKQQYEPPGFDLVLGMKDVRLALMAGEEANVPLPFASTLRDSFMDAIANGDAHKDWSAIARVAARRAGLQD